MNNNPNLISRRRFLGQASCAGIGTTSLFSTLLNLKFLGSASAAENPSDYKALVCLFLAGGCDSHNVLIPKEASRYANYQAIRQNLALPKGSLIDISSPRLSIGEYGLHPAMTNLANLFASEEAAFVANIGTLIQPITLHSYLNGSVPIPLGLFSHSDQTEQWQTSIPDGRGNIGWVGRMADLLSSLNGVSKVSMNISLNGRNIFQTGKNVMSYVVSDTGATPLTGYGTNNIINLTRKQAIDSMLSLQYSNIFERAYAGTFANSIETAVEFNSAIAQGTPINSPFNLANSTSRNLKMVAQSIAARNALGAKRQTFFVQYGGWDHHDEVLNNQNAMLPLLDQAVGEFYTAIKELGLEKNVTLFIASEFGRTLSSNGNGSDHAWGGNIFAVGGAVKGGKIYGQYPDLDPSNMLDVGRGRLIPTTSVDEFFAELALWMGVSKTNLPQVLPNIGRFYNLSSGASPIGFIL